MDSTRPEPLTYNPEPHVTIGDMIAFVLRTWKPVVAGCLVVGTIALLLMLFVLPDIYEASTVLVVVQPTFSSDLKPSTLTVQGYQRLLESDAVVAETTRRLRHENVLLPSDALRVGDAIQSRIFVSSRSEERELAPMIEAIARWSDPDAAAVIANTWAAVFLDQVRELMSGTTSSTVQFVDEQYRRTKASLAALEEDRLELDSSFSEEYDATAQRWDDKVLQYESETQDLIAAYVAETLRLMETTSADLTIETRTAQLAALRAAYKDLQDEQAKVASQLDLNRLRLESARHQLAATPKTLTLRRGITDEAVWEALATSLDRSEGTDLESLFDHKLASEELNPVYLELSSRTSDLELEVSSLEPRAEQLLDRLAVMTDDFHALDTTLGENRATLEKLRQQRAAGLANLKQERQLGLDHLKQDKERTLERLENTWETRVVQIERDIDQESELFSELATNFNEASLATTSSGVEDVRVGAAAVPPDRPQSSYVFIRSALAALFGGFLGLLFALVRASRPETSDG